MDEKSKKNKTKKSFENNQQGKVEKFEEGDTLKSLLNRKLDVKEFIVYRGLISQYLSDVIENKKKKKKKIYKIRKIKNEENIQIAKYDYIRPVIALIGIFSIFFILIRYKKLKK